MRALISGYLAGSRSKPNYHIFTLRSLVHLKQKNKGAMKRREYHTLVSSDPDIKREPFEFQAIAFTQP